MTTPHQPAAWAETELDQALDPSIEPWQPPRDPSENCPAREARYQVLRQPWRLLPDAPRCRLDACSSGRKHCRSPLVCSAHASAQPEAAHAASEYEDADDRPIPGAGPVAWLVLGLLALLVAAGAWHLAAAYGQHIAALLKNP